MNNTMNFNTLFNNLIQERIKNTNLTQVNNIKCQIYKIINNKKLTELNKDNLNEYKTSILLTAEQLNSLLPNTFSENVNINITDDIFINAFKNNKSYKDNLVAKYLTYIVDLEVL